MGPAVGIRGPRGPSLGSKRPLIDREVGFSGHTLAAGWAWAEEPQDIGSSDPCLLAWAVQGPHVGPWVLVG